jgi:hypothetical protein
MTDKPMSDDPKARAEQQAAQAKLEALRETTAKAALKSGTPPEQVAARPRK